MMYSPPVGGQKWALLVSCLVLAGCPGRTAAEGDTDGDEDGDGSTTDTTMPPTTLSTSMSGSATMTTMDSTSTTMPTTDPSDTDTDTDPTDTTMNPETMSCCEPHRAPSCDQEDVSTCVCKTLAKCCVFGWEQNCVDEALDNCDAVCDEDPTTTTGPSDCKLEQIELVAGDADLSGSWFEATSMVGEGQILVVGPPFDGAVSWTVPIPCEDNWRIWIRSFDQGNDDSFFVTVDGEPDPPAIVEADCGPEPGFGAYRWSLMNWRDFDEPIPCTYLEDPWVHQLDEGDHVVEFTYREATAIGRIIVTNDPAFDPEA